MLITIYYFFDWQQACGQVPTQEIGHIGGHASGGGGGESVGVGGGGAGGWPQQDGKQTGAQPPAQPSEHSCALLFVLSSEKKLKQINKNQW